MKVSIIAWDGGFRESYHAIEFVSRQRFPEGEYELVWVTSADTLAPEAERLLAEQPRFKGLALGERGPWHAGRCLNHGVANSDGDLLVLIDGDVVLPADFLSRMVEAHREAPQAAIYVRRWDQNAAGPLELAQLEATCQLTNPSNFGGCLVVARSTLAAVGGYEEHPVLGGPGRVSGELAVRLRNAGTPIIWHPTAKVYHPWHRGTGPSTDSSQQRRQAWVVRQRELHLDVRADAQQVERYLSRYREPARPDTNPLGRRIRSRLRRIASLRTRLASRLRRVWERR